MRNFLIFVFAPCCVARTPGRIHVRFIPLGGGSLSGPFGGSRAQGSLDMPLVSPISGSSEDMTPLDNFLRVLPLDHGGDHELDKMLSSIMQEIEHDHTEKELVPMMRLHVKDRFGDNHACKADADRLCAKDELSSLHCLGRNVEKLDKACIKAIEKSIPFICALEINIFCPPEKAIEKTLLQCLEEEAYKPNGERFSQRCKDSIITTRSIVDTLKKSKPYLVGASGEILNALNAGKSFLYTVLSTLVYGSLAIACVTAISLFFWREKTLAVIRHTAKQALVSKDKELGETKKNDFYDAALI